MIGKATDIITIALLIGGLVIVKDLTAINRPSVDIGYDPNNLTLDRAWYKVGAETIYHAIWGDAVEDEEAVIEMATIPKTIDDVKLLIMEYGLRAPWWSNDINLQQTIREYLSDSDIARINDDYQRKQIPWTW